MLFNNITQGRPVNTSISNAAHIGCRAAVDIAPLGASIVKLPRLACLKRPSWPCQWAHDSLTHPFESSIAHPQTSGNSYIPKETSSGTSKHSHALTLADTTQQATSPRQHLICHSSITTTTKKDKYIRIDDVV